MATQKVTINVPEEDLAAEKTDAESFGQELSLPAGIKLYELGRLSSGRAVPCNIPAGAKQGDG